MQSTRFCVGWRANTFPTWILPAGPQTRVWIFRSKSCQGSLMAQVNDFHTVVGVRVLR